MHEWQILDALTPIVLEMVPTGCVIDIGIGASTEIMTKHTREAAREHYSVDSSKDKCDWAETISHEHHTIFHGKSSAFSDQFNKDVALILMDGSHSARIVLTDALFFIEKMVPNATMFIHDTCPMEGYYEKKLKAGKEMNTYKARRALEEKAGIDTLTWRDGVGFTMVVKKAKDLPHYRD